MAIDDPVGIEIRQANAEIDAESDVPIRLTKLGLSGALAVALGSMPFVSQVLISLLTSSSSRFEKRFLRVAEALNDQQKRIEDKIPDRGYYKSDEFQTLLGLIIERLHTTHDDEKLKMFGNALANSGSSEFRQDSREEFIRILRDLSIDDLNELRQFAPPSAKQFGGDLSESQRFHLAHPRDDLKGETLSRTTRLIGWGLINESLKMRDFTGGIEFHSSSEARKAISDYLRQPPKRSYSLSMLGWRFLQFVAAEDASREGQS
jgi:hypothetical protein